MAGNAAFAQTLLEAHSLEIGLAQGVEAKDDCKAVVEAMRSHFSARPRFRLSLKKNGKTQHKLQVSCDKDAISATWSSPFETAGSAGKKPTAAATLASDSISRVRAGDLSKTHNTIALQLLREVLRKLPWRGEVARLKLRPEVAPPVAKPGAAAEKRFLETGLDTKVWSARLSIGYFESADIGRCAPIEVGAIMQDERGAQFKKMGEGLISVAREFDSDAELLLGADSTSAVSLVFRLAPIKDIGEELREGLAKCQSSGIERIASEGADAPGLAELSAPGVESGLIREYFGSSFFRMKAANSSDPYRLISIMVFNYIELGTYLILDISASRSIFASTYRLISTSERKPEQTFAEGYGGIRFPYRNWVFAGGGGIVLEKENVPYRRKTGGVDGNGQPVFSDGIRSFLAHPSALFSVERRWPGMWAKLRTSYGPQSESGSYLGSTIDLNFRLSDSWFIGFNSAYQNFGESAVGEPQVTLMSAGVHAGVALGVAR